MGTWKWTYFSTSSRPFPKPDRSFPFCGMALWGPERMRAPHPKRMSSSFWAAVLQNCPKQEFVLALKQVYREDLDSQVSSGLNVPSNDPPSFSFIVNCSLRINMMFSFGFRAFRVVNTHGRLRCLPFPVELPRRVSSPDLDRHPVF